MINHPNRATLYTVIRPSGTPEAEHCTVSEAASIVLNYDGEEYDIQADSKNDVGNEAQWELYSRRQGGRWTRTGSVKGFYAKNAQAAWPLIAREVIRLCNGWRGSCQVMTDADYAAMLAEAARDEEG